MTKSLIILVILSGVLMSCNKEKNRCFDKPGDQTSYEITYSQQVDHFILNDDLNLTLIHDTTNFIEVQGGKNMIQYILFEENNDELIISNENKCLFASNNDAIQLELHYTTINHLELLGYGMVNSANPIQNNLTVTGSHCFSTLDLDLDNDSTHLFLEGSVQVMLTGATNYIYAYSFGKGNLEARQLLSQSFHAHNGGIGDFHISAEHQYLLELRAGGDIFVYDTTTTDITVYDSGSGSIHYVP